MSRAQTVAIDPGAVHMMAQSSARSGGIESKNYVTLLLFKPILAAIFCNHSSHKIEINTHSNALIIELIKELKENVGQ